jgi:GNAT superfamily N-acetyltransferase
MHVTLLQASHAERYRSLMLEAYVQAADAFTSTAEERAAEPPAFWVKRIADPSGLSAGWGAFEGEDLVGTVALEFSSKPKTRHKGLVVGMYVTDAARRSGAGRALLRALIAHAHSRADLQLLTLTVTEGNAPAVKLYASEGFEVFGVEPMAILTPGGYRGKVHMWRRLRSAPALPPAAV